MTPGLGVALGVMAVVAALFIALPMFRGSPSRTVAAVLASSFVIAVSLGLYVVIGNPGVKSGAGQQPDIAAMVESLARRLETEPDDLRGWKMLGRSYMTLGNYAGAVTAFERAADLESSEDAQTLVALGEALLARDQARIEGRTSALFESALAIDPNNPTALFYGGIAAVNRGDQALAADRWEKLLGLNPPDEIRQILRARIAEWRGLPPTPLEKPGAVVVANVTVAPEVSAQLPEDAAVFVIARDPGAPSPPIAVARRRLAELPATVELGDGDSMIPGRSLSAFSEFELVARVSLSGQPIAQSGDWFGSVVVKPAETGRVDVPIRNRVP